MSGAKTPLPEVPPPSLEELKRFDASRGLKTSLRSLRRHFSKRRLALVLFHFGRRSLFDRPLKGIDDAGFDPLSEALVRRQILPALHLDTVLQKDLGYSESQTTRILGDIVAEVGAEFLDANTIFPTSAQWEKATGEQRDDFVRRLKPRFFNAKLEDVRAHESGLGFRVTACRFASLCRKLHRPHLAALFCEADSRYFDRPASPLKLVRTQTIGAGGDHCDFEFEVAGAKGLFLGGGRFLSWHANLRQGTIPKITDLGRLKAHAHDGLIGFEGPV